MSETPPLTLEILSGPRDGHTVTLEAETAWTRAGEGRLAFPWDEELGAPQARFRPGPAGWVLEGVASPHGTYRINAGERITDGTLDLAAGDILKASDTWLVVHPGPAMEGGA
jgi:hypothetical protein